MAALVVYVAASTITRVVAVAAGRCRVLAFGGGVGSLSEGMDA